MTTEDTEDEARSVLGRSIALRIVEDETFSERRFSPVQMPQESLQLSFSQPEDFQRLKLIAFDHEITAEGMHARPESNDPIVVKDNVPVGYNHFTVEMKSSSDGFLEIFWAPGDQPFGPERKLRVAVNRSTEFREYVTSWGKDLPESKDGYRFRIDPIDRKASFDIKAVRLQKIDYAPPRVENTVQEVDTYSGKITIGQETREAVLLSPERPLSRELKVPAQAELVFGLAKARENQSDVTFELSFVPRNGDDATPIFEHRLAKRSEQRWIDFSIPLEGLATHRGHLRARLRSQSMEDGVFWANPVITTPPVSDRPPNVILVSLDTLGARYLSSYGAQGVEDPFLARLAREGVVFENAISPSSLTHVAHGSLLTGRLPLAGSMFWLGGRRMTDVSLAQILRNEGYLTAAFTAGILVTESLGFDRGFDVFHQEDTLYKPFMKRVDISAILDKANTWLKTHKGASPFFLFLHSYEIHGPYYDRRDAAPSRAENGDFSRQDYYNLAHVRGRNPVPLEDAGGWIKRLDISLHERTLEEERVTEDMFHTLRDVYRSEIAYTDDRLGSFFEKLGSAGLLENTLILVTSDHGEAFFEHGLVEHGLLYEENLRVPLILHGPQQFPGSRRVTTPVSTVDLVPTLLELLEVETSVPLNGRSLVPALEGGRIPRTSFYAFVPGNGFAWYDEQGRKLIWRRALFQENFGRDELFDLTRDPSESTNLLPDVSADLRGPSKLARSVLRGLPGVYISFREFPSGEYDLELEDVVAGTDRLYAFEVQPIGPGQRDGDSHWLGTVRIGSSSTLLFLGQGSEGKVKIAATPTQGGTPAQFEIAFSEIGEEPLILHGDQGLDGTSALVAWRISGSGSDAAGGGLTAEEKNKLQSLGYLQ